MADQTENALAALVARDADLAAQVIAGDAAINSLQIEIDDRAVKLLALQAPAARDLPRPTGGPRGPPLPVDEDRRRARAERSAGAPK